MGYLLHELLVQSSSRSPDRPAVIYKDQTLTYRELDEISDQLAAVLGNRGVQRGDRVGLCLGKSIEAIVAVFGILKTAGAYVPLDPSAPARRTARMIDNCGMRALITNSKFARSMRAESGSSPLECIILTDVSSPMYTEVVSEAAAVPWREVLCSPPRVSPTSVSEDDLAYILYTSGSTGDPKGVMISHRASSSFINWAHDYLGLQPHDRISNHAPLHFDLSVFDIFATMKAGATLCVVPEELSVFPIDLANFIEAERITIWYSVPSVLTKLVLHGNLEQHGFPELRAVLFAGEVFPVKYLRQLKNSLPRAKFYNLYGPTETNVCTYYEVNEIPADRTEPFPIGKACSNAEVFALGDRREIAAPNEVGELYVAGESLMKGYCGMPDATREVLLPHPFPKLSGEKVAYRTGDLVKRDQDGNYHFLGRRDNMIKSRGYRVELGEVETVLYSHPKIKEVAVFPIADEEVGNRILAVVAVEDADESVRYELKRFCAERIPKYMVPDVIEFRPGLPKTSTGKIDKTLILRERALRTSLTGPKRGDAL